jgi:hypothetical protein
VAAARQGSDRRPASGGIGPGAGRHILIPLAGSAVLLYGVYEFIQPNQPPPANGYWKWILAIVVIAAVGTAVVYARRPDAIKLAGTIGPEFVQEDT